MYYLSFDIANKSLASSFLYYNSPNLNDILELKISLNDTFKTINDLNNLITNTFKYIYYNVKDLIPNKKVKDTTIIERSNSLKQYMRELEIVINKEIELKNIKKIYLLVEYQLSSNYNANAIYNQIIYEFSNNELYEIIIMNPSYKNKIYFNKELQHSRFTQKYTNNYIANKNHCKANFLYFLKAFNLEHITNNIKSKNIDDLADSFMQIFAFIKFIKS